MSILDEVAETRPVDLSQVVETRLPNLRVPEGAMRTHASSVALLTPNPVETYNKIMYESEWGETQSLDSARQEIERSSGEMDQQAIMEILGDPSVAMETKEHAIRAINSKTNSDIRMRIAQQYVVESSPDAMGEETVEMEEVRIGMASQIKGYLDYQEQKQAILNGNKVFANEVSVGKVVDFLAFLAPFSINLNAENLLFKMSKELGMDPSRAKALLLPGSFTQELVEAVSNVPFDQRAEVVNRLKEVIESESGVIFGSENQFNQWLTANIVFEEGGYSDFEKYLDNAVGLLDIITLGAVSSLRQGWKAADIAKAQEKARNIDRGAPTNSTASPSSPANVVAEVNPDKARDMFALVGRSEGDEVSQALYGVDRQTAITQNTLPQPRSVDGSVDAKVPDVDRKLRVITPDEGALAIYRNDGGVHLPPGEKEAARAKIVNKFYEATGMKLLDNMTQAGVVDGSTVTGLSGVFGTPNGGFLKPKEALEQAEFAFADFGLTRNDVTLMQRVNGEYVPVNFDDVVKNLPYRKEGGVVFLKDKTGKEVSFEEVKFVGGRSLVVKSGEDQGFIETKVKGGTVSIVHSELPKSLRGKGLGVSAYRYLIDEALNSGKKFVSDNSVSSDAIRIYESLEKRGYGVNKEELERIREPSGYAPTVQYGVKDSSSKPAFTVFSKPKDVEVTGDFVVKVETERNISFADIINPEHFDVKNNFFARLPHSFSGIFGKSQGSLQRWLMDPSSMFRPELSSGAITGFDRAVALDKALLKLHDDFGRTYKGLEEGQKSLVLDYIKQANTEGIEKTAVQLKGDGFSDASISAIGKWRKAWDTHFWFENADLVRSLNASNFKLFENGSARFFAKPIRKSYKVSKVYDPITDSVQAVKAEDLDALYMLDGTLAQLKRPVEIDGQMVDHMIVTNSSNDYLRALTERDQVLNYRVGYYQRQYNAPKYIEKNVYDKNGEVLYTKVIGYADNIKDAERFIQRKATEAGIPVEQFGKVRDDIRELQASGTDVNWDLASSGGRIAQRHRGKLLEDANGPVDVSDTPHILDPAESAVRASRSIAQRVAMRDFIDTSRERAIQNFEEFFPKDQYGRPKWTTADRLVAQRTSTEKKLADARSTVEYINYLEAGYINSIDGAFKATMNLMADIAGKYSSTVEKGVRGAGDLQPAGVIRQSVFMKYLALNPLRQLFVQTNQAFRMGSYNAPYVFSGGWFGDLHRLGAFKGIEATMGREAAIKAVKDAGHSDFLEIIKDLEETGLLSAVDRSNLARGPLNELAESTNPLTKNVGKAVTLSRKVGYDFSEQTNLSAHYLAVRDKFKREGKNLKDKAVKQEMHAIARNLTWDMNMGGDFPYNQNWASMVLQFAQVPHKAMLTYTSRKIPAIDKAKLALADTIMYGVPGSVIISNLIEKDFLPEDKEARDIITRGMQTYLYNAALAGIAGQDVEFDFTSLNPYGLDGWAGIIVAGTSSGLFDLLNQAPAANVIWKEGGDLREALVAAGRYINGYFDPNEGHQPETLLSVFNAFAKASSGGWSNYQKAKMFYEMGMVVDKEGKMLKDNYTFTEGVLQALGFPTQEVAAYYLASQTVREGTKGHKDEVESYYKELKRYVTRTYQIDSQNPEFQIQVIGMAKLMYKDDPTALGLINSWVARDSMANEHRLLRDAMEAANLPNWQQSEKAIRDWAQLKGENGKNLLKISEDMQKNLQEYQQKVKDGEL